MLNEIMSARESETRGDSRVLPGALRRANMAHIRQLISEKGLGCQAKTLKICQIKTVQIIEAVLSLLGSGSGLGFGVLNGNKLQDLHVAKTGECPPSREYGKCKTFNFRLGPWLSGEGLEDLSGKDLKNSFSCSLFARWRFGFGVWGGDMLHELDVAQARARHLRRERAFSTCFFV